MKRLFIALVCSFLAVGAYANNSTPKVAAATVKKVVVKEISIENKSNVKSTETENSALRRRQKAFYFYDTCGNMLTVWVSAGNSVSDASMATTAYCYAAGALNGGGGCY